MMLKPKILPVSTLLMTLLFSKGLAADVSSPQTETAPLIPATRLIFDTLMRDPSVCRGGDGNYYLTGTTGKDLWFKNDGIEVWRSTDLATWEPLGMVWNIDKDGTWQKQWTKKVMNGKEVDRRVVWAPEIHYIKGNYWISYCLPMLGMGLLQSASRQPAGPYTNAFKEPLVPGSIDASLFEDDDGKVYFLYGAGFIARMKNDMSGLAEKPRQMRPTPPDLDPRHHSKIHCEKDDNNHLGFEGPFLFKANGRYYFSCADSVNGRYSCMIASAGHVYGPYGPRHEAIPKGGHSTFFQAKDGQWWSACFSTTRNERPALARIELEVDGTVKTVPEAPPAQVAE
ncbi:MAG: family 43 glycosylhydrolase [Verrucomicrobiota bacterium]